MSHHASCITRYSNSPPTQAFRYHNSCTLSLNTLFRVENGVQLRYLGVRRLLVVTPAATGLINLFHPFPRSYHSQIPSPPSLSQKVGSFPYYYEVQLPSPILVALASTSLNRVQTPRATPFENIPISITPSLTRLFRSGSRLWLSIIPPRLLVVIFSLSAQTLLCTSHMKSPSSSIFVSNPV
jgi:hypothetical protein